MMNTQDMYTREKVTQIKQAEMLREAQNARLAPLNFGGGAAGDKLALALGVLLALATLLVIFGAVGFGPLA